MSVPRPAGMSRTMGVDCTTEGSEPAREVERLGCADTTRLAVAAVDDVCSELRIEIGSHVADIKDKEHSTCWLLDSLT